MLQFESLLNLIMNKLPDTSYRKFGLNTYSGVICFINLNLISK